MVLVAMFSAIVMTGCSSVEFVPVTPTDIRSDYYISLSGGMIFIGQENLDTSLFVAMEEEGCYKQNLGLYDFRVTENKVSEIRTASSEIKLSSDLYVGQTKKSLESYLTNTVKYKASDRFVYYDIVHSVGVEVKYDKDDRVEVLRLKSMALKE